MKIVNLYYFLYDEVEFKRGKKMVYNLSEEKIIDIQEQVKKVYKSLNIDINKVDVSNLYFPLEDILSKEKIKRLDLEMEDSSVSGSILQSKEITYIVVNKKSPILRKRFTVAHELGHYFLHRDRLIDEKVIIDYRDGQKNEKEIEADYFAGYLLVPRERLEKIYIFLKERLPEISDRIILLSKMFNVSKNCIYTRLDQEDLMING